MSESNDDKTDIPQPAETVAKTTGKKSATGRKTAARKTAAKKTPRKRTTRAKKAAAPVSDTPAPEKKAPQATTGNSAEPQPCILQCTPMTVRWRDLDAFNHVNNSKYLSYLEEARLRWMLGVPGQGLDDDVAPVVAAAHLNYRRPIEWPAEIVIELFVERLGTTSLSVGHRILAAADDNTLYCDGNVVMVWIDRANGEPAPLPAAVREACSA